MNTSLRLFAGLLLAGLAVATSARAEVAAKTNALGTYVRTVVYANASIRSPRIWSVSRLRAGLVPLNPGGDATGDLFPAIAENRVQPRWPWVMWSRFNGSDYDLVWSRWIGTRWAPIASVEAASSDDALDPSLAFNTDGRPFAVWLSQGAGPAQVSMSIFLATQWMTPFCVSEPGEDAANPSIAVLPDGRIQVRYDTPTRHVSRIVSFARPLTITDDISPMNTVSMTPPPEASLVKP